MSMAGEFRALPPGARIALIAPASPPEPHRIDAATSLLRDWGYEVSEGEHLRDVDPDLPYLAGDDRARAHDVQSALCDDTIDALVCARGGYGSARILPYLDPAPIRAANPKPLFGSSDITALHGWMLDHCRRGGWFSPMPATEAVLDDDTARRGLFKAMREGLPGEGITLDSSTPQSAADAISVTGTLRGGNLSLIAEGCAGRLHAGNRTPSIAVLEEVHEPAYHIDALLQQLLHAHWFDQMVGIVLGSWLDCPDIDQILRIVHRNLDVLGIPIAAGFDIGHGAGAQPVPLGAACRLDTRPDRARLTCLDPAETSNGAHDHPYSTADANRGNGQERNANHGNRR